MPPGWLITHRTAGASAVSVAVVAAVDNASGRHTVVVVVARRQTVAIAIVTVTVTVTAVVVNLPLDTVVIVVALVVIVAVVTVWDVHRYLLLHNLHLAVRTLHGAKSN